MAYIELLRLICTSRPNSTGVYAMEEHPSGLYVYREEDGQKCPVFTVFLDKFPTTKDDMERAAMEMLMMMGKAAIIYTPSTYRDIRGMHLKPSKYQIKD